MVYMCSNIGSESPLFPSPATQDYRVNHHHFFKNKNITPQGYVL